MYDPIHDAEAPAPAPAPATASAGAGESAGETAPAGATVATGSFSNNETREIDSGAEAPSSETLGVTAQSDEDGVNGAGDSGGGAGGGDSGNGDSGAGSGDSGNGGFNAPSASGGGSGNGESNAPSASGGGNGNGLQLNISRGDILPNEDSPEPEIGELPQNFRETSRGYKYLKKSDGKPFWRRDIQYDFLHELFSDNHRVFTNHFPHCDVENASNEPKLTFAELYVRTLADSSKSLRVLRERLIREVDMGIAVSKVCLLVNAGRMNTTVNFVPDMRSALRTYHLIPSLQVDPAGHPRPLQDTPRLKTILKAVCDGQDHLQTLLDVLKAPKDEKPNTNVIKLVFLMSTFFQNIPFHYDDSFDHDSFSDKLRFVKASPGPQNKFMEFFLNDEMYPENRARRFLWLMYTYLETLFTPEELAQNPFNPHRIPPVEEIPSEKMSQFDVDTEGEVEYAATMYHTRMMHLNGEVNNTNPKRGNKSKRERQKIRKQLLMDHNYPDDPDHDVDHDDHPPSDDMPGTDIPGATGASGAGISGAGPSGAETSGAIGTSGAIAGASPTPRTHDRLKRKRPAPSVLSLVEDARKPLVDDDRLRLTSPAFPVAGLAAMRRRFQIATPPHLISPTSLNKDSPLSLHRQKALVSKTKPFVSHVARVLPDRFRAARRAVVDRLWRYLAARGRNHQGFLGLEWENIRADVSHGIESYRYHQLGKELLISAYDDHSDDDHDHHDIDALKKECFASGAPHAPLSQLGDLTSIDLPAVDRLGAGFVPPRDTDRILELSAYHYVMLDALERAVMRSSPKLRKNHVSIDLKRESMFFS